MSTSRAIKPKRDDTQLSEWDPIPERAPSIMREDRPTVARILAMAGLFFLVLGGLAMLAPTFQRASAFISPFQGFFVATFGLTFVIYHSFAEHDMQFRRLYGALGAALILTGIVLRIVALRSGGSYFFLGGLPALTVGLVFLIATLRQESDQTLRNYLLSAIGILGTLMIAFGILNGLRDPGFLPGEGALLLVLGLVYVGSYIGLQDPERAYYAALTLGMVGGFGFVAGVIRSLPTDNTYLVPSGLILMGMSLVYVGIGLFACVDLPVIVMARRELASIFYSPVAYLIFAGQLLLAWGMFYFFLGKIRAYGSNGVLFEPIIPHYIWDIVPVIVQMFFVPALTMRLLSEEKRTGTLEVLLTAPISELSLVVAKFIAVWIFYMLLWLPWWVFLVGLRYLGQEAFDYRPILSFMVAMSALSAGFLAMGLFFSALTNNQVIAAVFAFVGMMAHLSFYLLKNTPFIPQGSAIHEVLGFINFIDLWYDSLGGNLAPRTVVFHLSVAIFFLFTTVKVLESRRWK